MTKMKTEDKELYASRLKYLEECGCKLYEVFEAPRVRIRLLFKSKNMFIFIYTGKNTI